MPVKNDKISIESFELVESGPYYVGERETLRFTLRNSAQTALITDPDRCDVQSGEYEGAGGHRIVPRAVFPGNTYKGDEVCLPVGALNDRVITYEMDVYMPEDSGTVNYQFGIRLPGSGEQSEYLNREISVLQGEPTVEITDTTLSQRTLTVEGDWTDPDGEITSRLWTVTGPNGYRSSSSNVRPSFTLGDEGSYTIELEVSDDENNTSRATERIQYGGGGVNEPPNVQSIDVSGSWPNFTATGNATDPEGDDLVYEWVISGPGGIVFDDRGNPARFEADSEGIYNIELTVTDIAGNTDTEVRGNVELQSPGGDGCQPGECPDGQVCENGECVPESGTGCSPGDCPPGETCVGGQCVPTAGGCQPGECPEGEVCVNGECVPESNNGPDGGDGFGDIALPLAIGGSVIVAGGVIATTLRSDDNE